MAFYGAQVGWCAVAGMAFETIGAVHYTGPFHHPVTGHLGDDRSGGD